MERKVNMLKEGSCVMDNQNVLIRIGKKEMSSPSSKILSSG